MPYRYYNPRTKNYEPLNYMMTVQKTYEFDPDLDLIGRGGFGDVYKAVDTHLDLTVAIKKYTGNLPAKYSLFEEIKRAIRFNHPNLVRYYDAFELDAGSAFGDKIQIGVMEFINRGDLMDVLIEEDLTEDQVTEIFIGILKGLQYLHQHAVIHRDLKPENILIQEDNGQFIPKIADFGISKVLNKPSTGASSLVIGSIEYMAPEQFNIVRYGKNKKLATNLDLWSLGTIIYEAFTGTAPFGKTREGFSREMIMQNILEKELPNLKKLPKAFQKIVRRCLVRNANKRAQTVDELLAILAEEKPQLGTRLLEYSGTTVLPPNKKVVSVKEPAIASPKRSTTDKMADAYHANSSTIYPKTPPKPKPKPKPKPLLNNTNFKFDPIWLLPFATALTAYVFFHSKFTIFGATAALKDIMIYPAIVCVLLSLVNTFILFTRSTKWFEWSAYVFSYLVLGYVFGESVLTFFYENAGIAGLNFDFQQHSFARYYPKIGMVLMLISIAYSLFVWRRK